MKDRAYKIAVLVILCITSVILMGQVTSCAENDGVSLQTPKSQ